MESKGRGAKGTRETSETVKQGKESPTLGVCIQIHTLWKTSRRKSSAACSHKSTTSLEWQSWLLTAHTVGVLWYTLFGKDLQGRWVELVLLWRGSLCMELFYGMGGWQCLRVCGSGIQERTLRVAWWPPDQSEEADEAFFKQLEEADELLMLVHMRDSNLLLPAGCAM